jgi:hypothetical protein
MSEGNEKQRRAAEVGLVLGTVFVIMGFAYGNAGIWMPGVIVLAIGLYARFKGVE